MSRFLENIRYILQDDEFPLEVAGDSAAELCELSYKMNLDDIEQYEKIQDWMFRHSWLWRNINIRKANGLLDGTKNKRFIWA